MIVLRLFGLRRAFLAAMAFCGAGCASLGSYERPSEAAIQLAAASINPKSREDALRQLRDTFRGIRHTGRLIFDECPIENIEAWAFEVSCTSYRDDPNTKEFKLIVEGRYSMRVPFCEPSFRAVRQVPTMAHYFFVNGFSFSGDAVRALRAYALLSWLCNEAPEPGSKQ